ncbi:MAG: archease [Actinomycetota bacterium]|nr:archease [Actinomycetota bacterium]
MNSKRAIENYKIIDHLSDIGVEFYGDNPEALFENAGKAMFSIMCDLGTVKPVEKKSIRIVGKNTNLEDLLVLWLERLIYRYEVDDTLFSEFMVDTIGRENHNLVLNAQIFGEKVDPEKHEIRITIKAPTYHRLEIIRNAEGHNWKGRVIFDI